MYSVKKICAVILVLIMAFTFFACGEDEAKENNSSKENDGGAGDVTAGGRVGYYDDDVCLLYTS